MTFWARFGHYRRTRPWWGGLCLIGSGVAVAYVAGLPFLFSASAGGTNTPYIVAVGLVALGVASIVTPANAPLLGIFAIVLALAAFLVANFGGLLVGSVLGIIGGSLVSAWGEKAPSRVQET